MLTTYKYICKESELNAKKVITEIIKAAEKAIVNPELYPIDKYKENNDGSDRAFEKHKYRKRIDLFRFLPTSLHPFQNQVRY